ncbi:MAG: SPASM domain-containing protein [Candidatus Omnitrophica bacterium]|nr:SPASM domain-containing protein [Candidatus Omnitrophota bacterium]
MRKVRLMVEITNRCNLKCSTCFSHQDGRAKNDISLKDFIKLIDRNIDHISHLSLYNYGEPLLSRSICGMIRYAKNAGIKYIKVATNGMLLTRQKAMALVDSGLDCISISLDGASQSAYREFRIGGNFKRVVQNIERLVTIRNKARSCLKIEIQFIIMRHNEQEIASIKTWAEKWGVDTLRLKTVLIKKSKWSYLLPKNNDYNRYAGTRPKKVCFKPREELVINSDGTVIPCCYIVGQDIKKYQLGNIFETTLEEILKTGAYSRFVTNCLTNKSRNTSCKDCNEGNLKLDYQVIHFPGDGRPCYEDRPV